MTDKRGAVLAVDLGSSNIRSACLIGGRPVVIPSRWGKSSAPSMVGWNGGWLAGEDAAALSLMEEGAECWNAGRVFDGFDGSVFMCGGQRMRERDLLSPLFRMQREDAEVYLGRFVSACVLALPGRLSVRQREVMELAASDAGLRDVFTVSSPAAAALAFGGQGRFLVLNFGAGAAEASVIEGGGVNWRILERVEVAGTGGRAFDTALAEWLSERLRLVPVPQDSPRWRVLLMEAEAIKIALSASGSYEWVPPVGFFSPRPVRIEREELERMTRFSIRRLAHAAAMLWERHSPERMLLLGGSCNIPLLREILEADGINAARMTFCGMDSFAAGAALYARIIEDERLSAEPVFDKDRERFQSLQTSLAALSANFSPAQAERLQSLTSRLEAAGSGQSLDVLSEVVKKLESALS